MVVAEKPFFLDRWNDLKIDMGVAVCVWEFHRRSKYGVVEYAGSVGSSHGRRDGP